MSFFQNITQGFDNLGLGDSKKEEAQQGQRDYGYHGPGQGGPPPAQYYAAPPTPAYQPPSDKPPLPQGWTPLFDQEHQRWYYAEEATGRTQWEAPGYNPPPPPMGSRPGDDSRAPGQGGYGAPGQGGYGAPVAPPPSYGGQGHEDSKEKKGSGAGGMILGAAGGLAIGAVGGALLHHALSDSDSDDERRHHQPAPYQPAPYQPEYQSEHYVQTSSYVVPPPVLPATDADGSSVSSSDREDVQEARARYEDALAAAADSDASSSEEEELEEAREEYLEEYEDTYGGDDDY